MKTMRENMNLRPAFASVRALGNILVSILAAVALVATMSIANLGTAQATPNTPAVDIQTGTVPVTESAIGAGVDLVAGNNTVPLPSRYHDYSSVLVRFTVEGETATQLSEAGSVFLSAAGNEVASATTFVPLNAGTLTFDASAPSRVRIEILAGFHLQDPEVGGQVQLADAPITLVDTAAAFGLPALPVEQIPVVANGQVSPQGTRLLIGRITTNFPAAATINLGGQELRIPAGAASTTTLLPVNERDELIITAQSAGDLRIDLIGHVTTTRGEAVGTAQNALAALTAPVASHKLAANSAQDVALQEDLGAKAVVALVSAHSAASRTAITGGLDAANRITGITADTNRESVSQIVLLDAANPTLRASSDVDVTVLPIAYVQDEKAQIDVETGITIESPALGDAPTIDSGVWHVEGSYTAAAPVTRIELYYNGELVSDQADISVDGQGGTWSHDVVPRDSGDVTLATKIFTDDGSTAETNWSGTITVPADEEIVLAPETRILDEAEVATISSPTPGLLISKTRPSLELGDVVVSGPSEGLPEGALGQVLAVVYDAGEWKTILRPVSLGNVILQGEYDVLLSEDAAGTVKTTPYVDAPAGGKLLELTEDAETGTAQIHSSDTQVAAAPMQAQALSMPQPLLDSIAQSRDVTRGSAQPTKISESAQLPIYTYKCEDLGFEGSVEGEKTLGHVKVTGSGKGSISTDCTIGAYFRLQYKSSYKPSGTVKAAGTLVSDKVEELAHMGLSVFEGNWTMSMSTVLDSSIGLESALEGKLAAELVDVKKEFKKTLRFMIGPVPVVLTPSFSAEPVLDFGISASVSAEAEFQKEQEFGIKFGPASGISSINRQYSPQVSFPVTTKSAVQLDAKTAIEIALGFSLYATIRADITGSAALNTEAEFKSALKVDLVEASELPNPPTADLTSTGTIDLGIKGNYDIGFNVSDLIGTTGVGWIDKKLAQMKFDLYHGEKELVEAKFALWVFPRPKNDSQNPADPEYLVSLEHGRELLKKHCMYSEEKSDLETGSQHLKGDRIPINNQMLCMGLPLNADAALALNVDYSDLEKLTLNDAQGSDAQDFVLESDNLISLSLDALELREMPNLLNVPELLFLRVSDGLISEIDSSQLPNGLIRLEIIFQALTTIPDFSGFNSLEFLILENNSIETIPLLAAPQLRHINLDQNKLSVLPRLELSQLEVLDLNGNPIEIIEDIQTPKLRELLMRDSRVREMPNFSSLPNLEWLLVIVDDLPELPAFDKMPSLERLDISRRDGGGVEHVPRLDLPALKQMSVNSQNLKSFGKQQLPLLEELNLVSEADLQLSEDVRLPNLKSLSVMAVAWDGWPGFMSKAQFPALEKLNIEDTKIVSLSDIDIPSLEQLTVFANSRLTDVGVLTLPNMKWIDLIDNPILVAVSDFNTPSLTGLRLFDNDLPSVPNYSYPELEVLDLSQNRLSTVPDFVLPKLRKLDISGNLFSSGQCPVFHYLPPDVDITC